jgi:phosphoglycerate dehydrogenase-like enzyme
MSMRCWGRATSWPHVSGGTDVAQHRAAEVFADNLRAYLDGRPLVNLIEWTRGY